MKRPWDIVLIIAAVVAAATSTYNMIGSSMAQREVAVPTYSLETSVGGVEVKHSCPRERGETPQEHSARAIAEFEALVKAQEAKR